MYEILITKIGKETVLRCENTNINILFIKQLFEGLNYATYKIKVSEPLTRNVKKVLN